ncbi:recombinase family protein [Geobacter sulfurreducens]|uniref:Integrative genetic element Gsu5, resolvase n=1 Tax=Geobacter sulfurreducens (strain ATCC 51573 / DSM 12127 / PCA) TaxID=243231 RepID=Q74CG3_GEOSL|nr:recombinase family protein [Geobacter sulfurreducens]AAR35088.1 integrative genetic element Gsu5, resolvase [Geobacter sulfurreducens PCA]UAC05706.1 recombinase family protein [Geobacter sulfurreducens]
MAMIGYARVSTEDQDLTAQVKQLTEAGCDRLYREKVSGVKRDRPELVAMLDYVREGDVVVVCKLDRIARSTAHLLEITETLERKGVAFRVLNLNLDTTTPTGKLMLTMLGAIATFEREMMLERQREGIATAKAEGRYTGRKATAKAKAGEVLSLIAQGKGKQTVADELGIGVASVYRIIQEHKGSVGNAC